MIFNQVYQKISKKFVDVVNFNGTEVSEYSKQLIKRMVEYNPNKRLKWIELYEHPLIMNSSNVLEIN